MSTKIEAILPYVRDTRRYGATYIHAAIRKAVHGWQGVEGTLNGERVVATFCGFGRSLQAGGNRYKAHCRYVATGKPVPSKLLSLIA
jgi:hypothetical protein